MYAYTADGNELEYEDDDEPLAYDDVVADFENDAEEKWGVTGLSFTPHWVQKKYSFGIKGIPREETNWLEAFCDFPCEFHGSDKFKVCQSSGH